MLTIAILLCLLNINKVNSENLLELVRLPLQGIGGSDNANFISADKLCDTLFNTQLATIASQQEQDQADSLCGNNRCWIGINDMNTEGTLSWLDRTTVLFTNFGNSNTEDLDCVYFDGNSNGEWMYADCDSELNYILCNAPNPNLFANIENSLVFQEFRDYTGQTNNLVHPNFGVHNGPIIRDSELEHDGFFRPLRNQKSGREISNICSDLSRSNFNSASDSSDENEFDPFSDESDVGLSNLAWLFGQFMDHEIVEQTASMEDNPGTPVDETAICIAIPFDDPQFDATEPEEQCIMFNDNAENVATDGSGQPTLHNINIVTSYIDGSAVYGSESDRIPHLRLHDGTGRMNTSTNAAGDINLPFNTIQIQNGGTPSNGIPRTDLFVTGEFRVNENVALTAMHTLWVREHNRLANEIRNAPGNDQLTGDEIFEYARAVNTATIQHIVYNEFLPAFYGQGNQPFSFDLNSEYDEDVDPSCKEHWSFVTFRVGHTLISDGINMRDTLCSLPTNGPSELHLFESFTKPNTVRDGNGIVDKILHGMSCNSARNIDPFIIGTLRNFLQFNVNGNQSPMDLMAINIERARDDFIVNYRQLRKDLGLSDFDDFNENGIFTNIARQNIEVAYDNVDIIDPIIGAFSEPHIQGGAFGETIAESWRRQFQSLIDGDRFFYKRYLKGGLLKYVETRTMRNVIMNNARQGTVYEYKRDHQNAFNIPSEGQNEGARFDQFTPIRLDLPQFGNRCFQAYDSIVIGQCDSNNVNQTFYYNPLSKEIISYEHKCLSVIEDDYNANTPSGQLRFEKCGGFARQKWLLKLQNTEGQITIRNFLGNCITEILSAVTTEKCEFIAGETIGNVFFPANQLWFLVQPEVVSLILNGDATISAKINTEINKDTKDLINKNVEHSKNIFKKKLIITEAQLIGLIIGAVMFGIIVIFGLLKCLLCNNRVKYTKIDSGVSPKISNANGMDNDNEIIA